MKIKFDNAKEVFSVVLAGDICPGGNGGKVCNPDYASVLAPVRDFITSGDLKLVQWETPTASKLDPIIKSGPTLNSEEPSIEILTAGGFTLNRVRPVDQFIHSGHVETVVLLSRVTGTEDR